MIDTIMLRRKQLVALAERYGFDFLHPEVIAASRDLDALIVQHMKRQQQQPA